MILLTAVLIITPVAGGNVSENITLETGIVAKLDVVEKLNYVASKVFCPCGCGEILVDCHCDTAISVKDDITRRLSEGATEDQILAYLVSIYGTSILINEDVSKIRKSRGRSGVLPLYIAGAGIFGILGYYYGKSRSKSNEPDYSRRVEEEIKTRKTGRSKTKHRKKSGKKGRK